jgi:HK97 family phage major capsid protein
MAASIYRIASLIAPVAVLAVLGIVGLDHAHAHVSSFGVLMAATPVLGIPFTQETKDALEKNFAKLDTDLQAWIKKAEAEVKTLGGIQTETKNAIEKLAKDGTELAARLLVIEQKLTAPRGGSGDGEVKSIGQLVTESEGWKALVGGAPRSGAIKVGSLHKTAIVNATGQNQPLVPAQRVPGIITAATRRLTVRDLLPALPASSNLIEFVKETLFTNAAAPQAGENVGKAESAMTFELDYAPVQTIAHWIPVSRQILSDAPALSGYINARLMYGLKLKEETQLLSGSGSGQNISGLVTNATAFDTSYTNTSTDTYIDVIRHAITQVRMAELDADGIILNPKDWEKIELVKETGSGISSGAYVFANPHSGTQKTLWGLPVVDTASMSEGQFLVGAFSLAAAIWDKDDATVEVSREHSDFFVKNMAAILCEERLGLTVFRTDALIYGGFPFGS